MATAEPIINDRGKDLIKHYLLGGAALGGGLGLATSVVNWLNNIHDEQDDTDPDDGTLYLHLKDKKKEASVAGGLALSGGLLSLLGSYALIHNAYTKLQKNEAQKRLEDAQQGYIDTLDTSKTATAAPDPGKPMGLPETIGSLPLAGTLLVGLASAVVANKLLNKTFPEIKPPSRRNPRRVVLQDDDATTPDGAEKVAFIRDEDGVEFLHRMLLATKSASLRPYKDLICGIGQGRRREIAQGLREYGAQTTFDMVKGASSSALEEPYLSMAVTAATNDPETAPSLGLIAAAEAHDHFSDFCKMAAAMPQEHKEYLEDVAGVLGWALKTDGCAKFASAIEGKYPCEEDLRDMEKYAGMLMGMLDDVLLASSASNLTGIHPFKKKVQMKPGEGQSSPESTDEPDANDDGDPDKTPDTVKLISTSKATKEFSNKHKDVIDAALNGSKNNLAE